MSPRAQASNSHRTRRRIVGSAAGAFADEAGQGAARARRDPQPILQRLSLDRLERRAAERRRQRLAAAAVDRLRFAVQERQARHQQHAADGDVPGLHRRRAAGGDSQNAALTGRHACKERFPLLLALLLSAAASAAEPQRGQWPYYGGDAGSSKYSALAQIDAGNVRSLQVAWTWNSPDDALVGSATRERPGYFKPTPIMIDGVLYTSTPFSQVAAIDAGTGRDALGFRSARLRGRPPARELRLAASRRRVLVRQSRRPHRAAHPHRDGHRRADRTRRALGSADRVVRQGRPRRSAGRADPQGRRPALRRLQCAADDRRQLDRRRLHGVRSADCAARCRPATSRRSTS